LQNNKAHRAIWGLPANDKTKIIVEKSIFKNNEITANNGNDFTTNHGALIWFEKFTKGRFEIISSQFIDNKFDPRFGVEIGGDVLLASVLWLQPLDNDSEYDLILENNSIVSNEGLTYAPISLYLDRDVVSKNNYVSNNNVTCNGITFLKADMDPESRTCDLIGFKQTSDLPTKVPIKSITPSSQNFPIAYPTVMSNLCVGNRNNYTTPFGKDCSVFNDISNDIRCYYGNRSDVCSECGKCSDPQTEVPTTSPTVVPNCEKDNGKKFEYRGDKYSCKQLNKTRRKYRKRICKRVKKANKLCPVICKYKT